MGILPSRLIPRLIGGEDDEEINQRPRFNPLSREEDTNNKYSTTGRPHTHDVNVDEAIIINVRENNNNNNNNIRHDRGRWIKHYSSFHRILLVGEGDFSFSASLAKAFGCRASNLIATSFNSQDFLMENYQSAMSNIFELSIRKSRIMYEIDATTMATHPSLRNIKFDRIIFNFPFAGFFKEMSRKTQIWFHRQLVSMFLENAKEMISEDGEIHISHKTNGFHREWKLEIVASWHGLTLIEAVNFNHLDYPGYNTKRGFGGDNNFDCYPSKTYKFGI
ncbi:hypothetical protein RD792_008623 [Penstemon davidsonii]|uniref:25S rRNA (uridine-N(3))-methyltransferase BMT5-like domain-containing protein n=1 Tax=Penstemon davidsonii TaxID=160366 RepID=A0ABR0DAA2_9LAMI|nr:hypothetical protein RD792_008623 [Penstemon davidsonii]